MTRRDVIGSTHQQLLRLLVHSPVVRCVPSRGPGEIMSMDLQAGDIPVLALTVAFTDPEPGRACSRRC
jgi:hypothetical protein